MENLIFNMGYGVAMLGKSLKKRLYSDCPLFYNHKLKIVSNSCREMFDYCVSRSDEGNRKLREYNSATRPIYIFPKLCGMFLKRIIRYKNISLEEKLL